MNYISFECVGSYGATCADPPLVHKGRNQYLLSATGCENLLKIVRKKYSVQVDCFYITYV
jgi:hypothetical protein